MSAQTTRRSLPSIQKPETGHRTATTPSNTGRSRNGSRRDSAITDGKNDRNAQTKTFEEWRLRAR